MSDNQSFYDIQTQMRGQMQAQVSDSGLKEASQHMSEAAKSMTQANMSQAHQTNMLVQSIQQQQSQLSALTASVSSSMVGAAMTPPPMPPPPPPPSPGVGAAIGAGFSNFGSSMVRMGGSAFGMARDGMGFVAPILAAHASRLRGNIQNFSDIYNPASQQAMWGSVMSTGMSTSSAIGVRQSYDQGVFRNMYNSMGVLYNAHMNQGVNFAHQQDASLRGVGMGLSDHIQGAAVGAADLFTFRNAGSLLGGMAGNKLAVGLGTALGGPLGGIAAQMFLAPTLAAMGSQAGGAIGDIPDALNPIRLASDIAKNSIAMGEAANLNAGQFLRGGGSASRPGQFNIMSQGLLGRGLARDMLSDLTFGSSDYTDAQRLFNERGLNRGVQSAAEYRTNFKNRMKDAREIMKAFNVSLEEAADFMAMEFNQMGFGANRSDFRSKMVAAAHMAGLSPMQIAQLAAGGASGAGQMGLMAQFGAGAAMSSASLAGMSATMGQRGVTSLDQNLLATVGGEQGLQALLQQQMMRFTAGTGGTLMALGGGAYGTDVMGAISRAGAGLNNDRIIGFMANRHRELSEQSPEMMQYQQFAHYRGLAQQLSSMGGSEEDRMRIIAQSDGASPAEAEAIIQAGKTLGSTARRNAHLQSIHAMDMERDVRAEQFGVKGRMERWLRGTSVTRWGLDKLDFTGRVADVVGGAVSNRIFNAMNEFHGIDEIAGYSYDIAKNTYDRSAEDWVVSGMSPQEVEAARIRSNRRDKLRGAYRDGELGSITRDRLGSQAGFHSLSTTSALGHMVSAVPIIGIPTRVATGVALGHSAASKLSDATGVGNFGARGVLSKVAETLGVDESEVTAEDMQYALSLSGASKADTENIMKTVGMEYKDDPIMSARDINKQLSSDLIMRVGTPVKDHVMMEAAGSKEFKRILSMLDRAHKLRRKGSEEDQSAEYKILINQVSKEIGNIKNPAVSEALESIMSGRGIKTTAGGKVDLSGVSALGLFKSGWEERLDSVQSDIQASHSKDSMMKGLGQFVGGQESAEGLLNDYGQIIDREGLMERLSFHGEIAEEDVLKMFNSDNANQKAIAATILKARRGDKLTDEQLGNFQVAVAREGLVLGANVRGKDGAALDENMMATETIESLKQTQAGLAATADILAIIARDQYGVVKNYQE